MNAVRPTLYLVDAELERLSLLKQAGERCGEFQEIRGAMDAHLAYQELLDKAHNSHALRVLVIAHWQTSNMSGAGLACALRAHPGLKEVPVIAVSGSPETDRADALEGGCKAFFRSPVGLPGWIVLLRKVRRAYCEPPRQLHRVKDRAKRSCSVQNAHRCARLRWILHLPSVCELVADREGSRTITCPVRSINSRRNFTMAINNVSQAQSGAQEALESVAQTKTEAAKGDAQAARKLAVSQARQADPSPPEGTARVLNASA